MIKKIVFAAGVIAGLMLAPVFALAAAAPSIIMQKGATTSQSTTSAVPANNMMPGTGINMMYPCAVPMQNSGANLMYRTNPCMPYGGQPQMNFFGNSITRGIGAWLGVMFVITVALVWAILLLVIALLWKLVCKHKRN